MTSMGNGREQENDGAPAAPAASPPVDTAAVIAWSEVSGRDERLEAEILNVDVAGFEGPLDMLLAMARTQKVDLTKISILALAEQYITYIAEMKALRLEVAADYLVMAAWLAFLKSKLLLPKEDAVEDGLPTAEAMAARLQFRLLRLEAMREASAKLFTRKRLGQEVFPRGMPEGVKTIRERQYSAEIYDLIKAYAEQRRRTTIKRAHVVKRRIVWSIKDARHRLERLVGASAAGSWVQLDFFLEQYLPEAELGRTALASSFGATLEMAREGMVELRQAEPFAPIYMRRREAGAGWERIG